MEGPGSSFKITEVVGNWDTGTSHKVTADALAVHGVVNSMACSPSGGLGWHRAGDDGRPCILFVPM